VTRVYEYLLGHSRLPLVPDAPDSYGTLVSDWITRNRGTIMPPGPSVESYHLEWISDMVGLEYTVDVKWAKHMDWLSRAVEPWQISNRSRDVAIADPHLQPVELDHRIAVVLESLPSYGKVKASPSQSRRLYEAVLHNTLKFMHYSPEWKNEYIKDHIGSSMGEGIQWVRAREVQDNEWLDLLSIHRDNINNMIEHPGYGNALRFFTGIRSRPNSLPGFRNTYHGTIERSRIIGFHPALSQWTVFIQQKAAWYKAILEETEEIMGVQGEYIYPYTVGGQVYLKFAALLEDKLPFQAYDGKAWEASIPQILGSDFNPFLFKTGPISQLPSGITVTSLLDTMASIVTTSRHKGKFVILGDDVNYFGYDDLSTPFEAYQPEDTKHRYFLGMVYDPVVNMPRITGFKVTQDNASKRIPFPTSQVEQEDDFTLESRDARDRVVHAGLYLGHVGEGTLLTAVSKIDPNVFASPQENIQRVTGDYRAKGFKAYTWAERLGVDNLFKPT